MTEQDFEKLLALGYETNGVEFKGRGNRTDSAFLAGVIRAILGMANRRDGGLVIIGVDSDSLDPEGFDDDEVKTWLNYDELAARVNEYASPSVRFDLEAQAYQGKKFPLIRVHEFDDIPILCVKDFHAPGKGPPVLRRGACYVRARHKPETSEIPSEEEMRELLKLAVDKGVREFVTRAQKAGLSLTIQELLELAIDKGVRELVTQGQKAGLSLTIQGMSPPPSDESLSEKQIEELE